MYSIEGLPRALLATGLTTTITTIMVVWVVVPFLVHWQITRTLRLEPGTDVFTAWTDIKIPILLTVHLFNITNHEDVLKGGIPKLQELGPYVYEQKRSKEVINVDSENGTITYRTRMLHFFRPELSNGTEEDLVTILNVPLLSAAHKLGTLPTMVRYMGKLYLDSFEEQPFVHANVGTVLFKGWHVPMMESISQFYDRELLPDNKFAFFIERNRTSPDVFEVDTGVQDYRRFGKIKSWRGRPDLDMWDGPTCNMINGSDTTLYSPYVTKDRILRGFEAEACRSVHFTYEREEQVEGIPGYRFTPPKDILTKGNPDNQCFCMEEDKSKCPKSGVLSVGPCREGVPMSLSNPHFLYADPSYAEPFGMRPNASIHDSFMILEATTGVVLKGRKRGQLNILLEPSDTVDGLRKVPKLTVPLLWAEEFAVQSEAHFKMLLHMLVIPMKILDYMKRLLLAMGCALSAAGVIIAMQRSTRKKKLPADEKEGFLYTPVIKKSLTIDTSR